MKIGQRQGFARLLKLRTFCKLWPKGSIVGDHHGNVECVPWDSLIFDVHVEEIIRLDSSGEKETCPGTCAHLNPYSMISNESSRADEVQWKGPCHPYRTCHMHLLFYNFIILLADYAEPCPASVPRQHWAAEKQTQKLSSSFSPAPSPTHVTSARKQPSSPDIMVGRAACACALHPFLLCLEHDNGSVRCRTLLIPTNTSK